MTSVRDVFASTGAQSDTTANRQVAGDRNSTSLPPRPTSSHTLRSTFADSAVDMDAHTPTELLEKPATSEANRLEPVLPPTPPPIDQTLSEKMRQLTAVAWTSEQDETMTAERRERLKSMLKDLEAYLEPAWDAEEKAETHSLPTDDKEQAPTLENLKSATINTGADNQGIEDEEEEDDEWIDESELIAVRTELAATVQSMRMRQEEQRHLHQLTIHKLEAVAQRCLAQEQQADDLLREVRELRLENHTLANDNQKLRERLSCLEAEAAHKDVAVHAMSSAVAGLEGWIDSTQASRPQTPIIDERPKRQRVVIRGKGRFRGRYYVDEDGDHAVAYSLADAAAESQELHDGVKAWLRGFRDVEEELRQHDSPIKSHSQGRFRRPDHHDEDEWGEFQSPDSCK